MSDTPKLTREIKWRAAYDKRSPDPKTNYGIHGVNCIWILRGEQGAIQFVIYTNWHLPHVQAEQDAMLNDRFPHLLCHPSGADVGYHSKVPRYEGQEPMDRRCQFTGGICYYDGSSLAAKEMLSLLIREGDEAVWKEMENWYNEKLQEVPA